MTTTTRKPLTAQERLDHHNAYHVSGMMDRECPDCDEILSLLSRVGHDGPADYKEYFTGGKGK